jgi:hypothetical protein
MKQNLLAALAVTSSALVCESVQAHPLPATERYAFSSEAFASLVQDSYRELGRKPESFTSWLQSAYEQQPKVWLGRIASLNGALEVRRLELAIQTDPSFKARLERKTGIWLHRLVKGLIPKFSLDHGFEFVHAVNAGERQCLLQSVLIAALAQEMGINAGTAMVWRNQRGQVSNLGHVVTVFKLSDGKDVLVDASDPEAFMQHQGLLMNDSSAEDLRFLEPKYDKESNITAYVRRADGATLKPLQVAGLERNYLRSQFYYYRGERTPNGFFGPSSAAGLVASARFLETAIRCDDSNPLAVYVLGLVYRKQGREAKARVQFQQSYALYNRYGFVPSGLREVLGQ